MKIVIIGTGKVGQSIMKNVCQEGHDITIIDRNIEKVNNAINTFDVLGICGTAPSIDILQEADIQHADLVCAVTSSDEINLLTCYFAHKLGAKDTIARVRNPEFSKHLKLIKDDLGLSLTINPEYEVAKIIASNLNLPSALNIETFAKGLMELVELKIEPNSILDNISLIDLAAKYKFKVLVCAVERENEVYIPVGDFVLKANDRIHVAASHNDLIEFFDKATSKLEKPKSIMIIGGGKISLYFCQLVENSNYKIKIIDRDLNVCKNLSETLKNVDIIQGDGSDHDLLLDEGLDDIDAFMALTGIDEENIIISMFAQMHKAKKIITKINNPVLNKMLESLSKVSVFSPKDIIADQVISYIRAKANNRGSNVKTLYKLVNQKVEALEFNVNANFSKINIPLKNIKIKKNILIAGIIRNNTFILPGGNHHFEINDSVIVITTDKQLEDLSEILQ